MILNTKKIFGWVVIVIGLVVIGQAINTSYQFFTAKADFPVVFKAPAAVQNVAPEPKLNVETTTPEQAQAQLQQAMGAATNQAIANILPADAISKLLNAIVWSIFATFLVYAGAHIAGIGIKMIG
ncbi:MAG: hypothetical protein WCX69_01270 [Candidatus Paceibacterota bacterium]